MIFFVHIYDKPKANQFKILGEIEALLPSYRGFGDVVFMFFLAGQRTI